MTDDLKWAILPPETVEDWKNRCESMEIIAKQNGELVTEAREAAREILSLLQDSAADHEHDELLFEKWYWLRPGAWE
jgi:hypothetical protein